MEQEYLKKFLKNHHLSPNATYGQNFLMDEEVLDKIAEAARVSSNDCILEVGPGIGNLTRKLLETGAFVLSVEKDPKFFPVLKAIKKDFPKTFRYEIADVLEFDYLEVMREFSPPAKEEYPALASRAGGGGLNAASSNPSVSLTRATFPWQGRSTSFKVVANIPYYITGKILQMLLNAMPTLPTGQAGGRQAKHKPTSITVLTQKEVAERIMAKAGELSVLAISVQIFGAPKIFGIVPAKSFYPAPKVDSAILGIDLSEKPKFKIEDEKKFFRVIKACFAGKRKQIHNTLKNNLLLEKNQVEQILASLKINPAARPQELKIEDWIKLVDRISNYSNF